MRRVLVLVLVAGFLAGCGSSTRTATSLPGLTSVKLAKLRTYAFRAIDYSGDAHPSSVTIYASRENDAICAAASHCAESGGVPVYLLVMRGHFVCSCSANGATGAHGATEPPKLDIVWAIYPRATLDRATLNSPFGSGGMGYSKKLKLAMLGPGLPLRLNS